MTEIPPIQALKKLPIWWQKNTKPNNIANFSTPNTLLTIPEVGVIVDAPVKPRNIAVKTIVIIVLGIVRKNIIMKVLLANNVPKTFCI